MDQPASTIKWLKTIELGYATEPESSEDGVLCFNCGSRHVKLLRCGNCQVASYCQKDCQVQDWKKGKHKAACSSYKRVGIIMRLAEADKEQACNDLFGRIRFYVCPYAVYKASSLGRGFLFIQSDLSLVTMSLAIPKDTLGRPTPNRAVLVHFLTTGEFDVEVCREDFEMASVRSELCEAVDEYDEDKEVVVLFRFRCGHLRLGKSPLVPDLAVSRKLGLDYFAENDTPSLQLNIDDT